MGRADRRGDASSGRACDQARALGGGNQRAAPALRGGQARPPLSGAAGRGCQLYVVAGRDRDAVCGRDDQRRDRIGGALRLARSQGALLPAPDRARFRRGLGRRDVHDREDRRLRSLDDHDHRAARRRSMAAQRIEVVLLQCRCRRDRYAGARQRGAGGAQRDRAVRGPQAASRRIAQRHPYRTAEGQARHARGADRGVRLRRTRRPTCSPAARKPATGAESTA